MIRLKIKFDSKMTPNPNKSPIIFIGIQYKLYFHQNRPPERSLSSSHDAQTIHKFRHLFPPVFVSVAGGGGAGRGKGR